MKCPFRKTSRYIVSSYINQETTIPKEAVTIEEFAECCEKECMAYKASKDGKGYCSRIILMPE